MSSGVSLPVDPSLVPSSVADTAGLLAGTRLSIPIDTGYAKTPSVLIAEGIPPVPGKLLDKVRRWEFVDLAALLDGAGQKVEDIPTLQDGRVVLIQSVEQAQRRRKQISDIFMWSKAFAVYMAALASAPDTSSKEVVGLIAHLYLITQLSKDLGTSRCLKYDHDFREWAAAKGVRVWGELNLTIYGRCLAYQTPISSPAMESGSSSGDSKLRRGSERKGKLASYTKRKGTCFKWNFENHCERVDCHFSHACFYCGEDHRAFSCVKAPKRAKQDGDAMQIN